MNATEKAISLVGTQTILAKAIGTTQQTVSIWVKTKLSAEFVIKVAEQVDYQVTPHELRPDLYPHPDDGLPLDKRGLVSTQTNQETS